ncbi:type II toxin-antitoxin system RelB/DinJ family antitoxin [Mycoavidus sp. HKI]|uniref:type II toxin-antitoxin system RelB/DinJ family antitoxin n=1 Tax=Mycoavidus sp. HKI TaxID=2840467 RepID=UPI001CC1207E|nr:type II toxin-antitoxin system RelB/DinJ family antitoxin [Mycoavidus sp. HKI]UAW63473.1 type II toxin-antitoxin system RelB/DinJ family antitoxin [Mycoavidus sp. HKI]
MSATTVVRARIDEHIKEEATAVLAAIGLTVSDAFRILLTRITREKALPFEPLVPNTTTIEAIAHAPQAMKEARHGKLETVTLDELQKVLDADD